MRFEGWYLLFLFALIPLLHRWWFRRNLPARVRFPLPVPAAIGSKNPTRILLVLRYLAFLALIVALARPQSVVKQMQRSTSGIEITMVMDFSASMNIEDLGDRSRFEIAKDLMERFIRARSNDRIGFVIFSGEPLTLAPPTMDHTLVLRALRDAQIGELRDGTAIGDGLSMAVRQLKDSKAKSRIVVLLTDGDNNMGQVDPATAGELAAGYGIRVYTIAVGREGRVKLPMKHKGLFGNVVTTYQYFDNALNPELLKHIASITGGKFYRATDEKALETVFTDIDRLEKADIQSYEKVKYNEGFEWPLRLGFLLLLLEQLLARGLWRVVP